MATIAAATMETMMVYSIIVCPLGIRDSIVL